MPSGAWRSQTRETGPEMLETSKWRRDPQHRAPDPEYGVRNPSWEPASGMSATPSGMVTREETWTVDESTAVLLDQTPQSHQDGVGAGPGLTTQESMAVNAAARSTDQGATAARRFASPYRDDGTYRAELETQPLYNAGSPETLRFQMHSDPEISPNARAGNRVARVLQRIYQTMRWEPDHRPLYVTNAYTARDQAAPSGGAFATSPFSTLARVVRDDPARPQLRRTPPTWDDALTVDGTQDVNALGFQSWGL